MHRSRADDDSDGDNTNTDNNNGINRNNKSALSFTNVLVPFPLMIPAMAPPALPLPPTRAKTVAVVRHL